VSYGTRRGYELVVPSSDLRSGSRPLSFQHYCLLEHTTEYDGGAEKTTRPCRSLLEPMLQLLGAFLFVRYFFDPLSVFVVCDNMQYTIRMRLSSIQSSPCQTEQRLTYAPFGRLAHSRKKVDDTVSQRLLPSTKHIPHSSGSCWAPGEAIIRVRKQQPVHPLKFIACLFSQTFL